MNVVTKTYSSASKYVRPIFHNINNGFNDLDITYWSASRLVGWLMNDIDTHVQCAYEFLIKNI